MIEERGKFKLVIKLKKMKTNSSTNYNDKLIIQLNFLGILRKLVEAFRISQNKLRFVVCCLV